MSQQEIDEQERRRAEGLRVCTSCDARAGGILILPAPRRPTAPQRRRCWLRCLCWRLPPLSHISTAQQRRATVSIPRTAAPASLSPNTAASRHLSPLPHSAGAVAPWVHSLRDPSSRFRVSPAFLAPTRPYRPRSPQPATWSSSPLGLSAATRMNCKDHQALYDTALLFRHRTSSRRRLRDLRRSARVSWLARCCSSSLRRSGTQRRPRVLAALFAWVLRGRRFSSALNGAYANIRASRGRTPSPPKTSTPACVRVLHRPPAPHFGRSCLRALSTAAARALLVWVLVPALCPRI